jgi:hypothetical protein
MKEVNNRAELGKVEVSLYGDGQRVIIGFKDENAEYSMYGSPSAVLDMLRWLEREIMEMMASKGNGGAT